jgi:YD repeat-containing protein
MDRAEAEISYSYEAKGRVLSVTNALSHSESFTYDELDRLVQVNLTNEEVT